MVNTLKKRSYLMRKVVSQMSQSVVRLKWKIISPFLFTNIYPKNYIHVFYVGFIVYLTSLHGFLVKRMFTLNRIKLVLTSLEKG